MASFQIAEQFVQNTIAELNNLQGWKYEIQNEKVTLLANPHYKLESGDQVRGLKLFCKINIPFVWLFKVLQEIEHRQIWDSHETEVTKRISLNEQEDLCYNLAKSPNRLLFSARDFLSIRRLIKQTNSNTNKPIVYFVSKSVEEERFPHSKGVVRGKIHVQVMRIEEVSENVCDVGFFSCMELGGSVPSFIMGMLSKRLAENFTEGLYKGYEYVKTLTI